jgi:methyl-accepting chemotaxis protein
MAVTTMDSGPTRIASTRGFSIKLGLVASIGGLVALLAIDLARGTVDSWTRYRSAAHLEAVNAAGNRLIAGVFEVLMERLATSNALQTDATASADARREIEMRRKGASDGVGAGMELILPLSFPNKDALATELRSALAKAHDYRRRADEALTQPRAQRDPELVKNLIPVLSAFVKAAQDVWTASLYTVSSADPVIAKYAALKQIGWTMRDTAGLERSLVASAISAKQPIAAEALGRAAEYRAAVDYGFKMALDMTGETTEHMAVRAAIARAREHYFDGFRPLADKLKAASASGANYPITVADWVATTTPQLGTLLEVMYGASRASEDHAATLTASAQRELVTQVAALVLGLMLATVCAWIVLGRVTSPLDRMRGAVARLADGDYIESHNRDAARRDEIGAMARGLEVLRRGLGDASRQRVEQEADKGRAENERRDGLQRVAEQVERQILGVVGDLGKSAGGMQTSARSMVSALDGSSSAMASVAAAATQASMNVETVAAAANQLSASIGEIGSQVQRAADVSREAAAQANKTNETVESLAEAGQRIGDVVNLIQSIAAQTNLLALNATIEAARAGEAGKGFAVVASEVKNLANQTARATEDIKTQVDAIQTATKGAVEAIGGIRATIDNVNGIATAIASAVEEQGAATQEITRNIDQAATGTRAVSSSIATVSSASEGIGRDAAAVLAASEALGAMATQLRDATGSLVRGIRQS